MAQYLRNHFDFYMFSYQLAGKGVPQIMGAMNVCKSCTCTNRFIHSIQITQVAGLCGLCYEISIHRAVFSSLLEECFRFRP